jgi:predicted RNA-binding Zn-ribbon protein involved in translation (DUF1610 family)
MTAEPTIVCASCGAEISSEVPEYYVELECFRIIRERGKDVPRRGSKKYHEVFNELLPQIKKRYLENSEMYDEGHRWCPKCGIRLCKDKGFGLL